MGSLFYRVSVFVGSRVCLLNAGVWIVHMLRSQGFAWVFCGGHLEPWPSFVGFSCFVAGGKNARRASPRSETNRRGEFITWCRVSQVRGTCRLWPFRIRAPQSLRVELAGAEQCREREHFSC